MIKIYEKKPGKIVFSADVNVSLANAIRRSIHDIPILAISEVEIFKNDSVLYDEMIAHRFGLVPLKSDKTLNEKEKCSCKGKGCSKCQVNLKISKKGPSTVYSGELKGSIKPVYDSAPITILRPGQEFEIVATAILGRGTQHAKYVPGILFYREFFEASHKKGEKFCEDCLKNFSAKIISPGIEKGEEIEFDKHKCEKCSKEIQDFFNENKNKLEIKKSKGLLFFIESFGQISAEDILKQSIKSLKNNLKILAKK